MTIDKAATWSTDTLDVASGFSGDVVLQIYTAGKSITDVYAAVDAALDHSCHFILLDGDKEIRHVTVPEIHSHISLIKRVSVHAVLRKMGQMEGSQDISRLLKEIADDPVALTQENTLEFYERLFDTESRDGHIVRARVLMLRDLIVAHHEADGTLLPSSMIESLQQVTRRSAMVALLLAHRRGQILLGRRLHTKIAKELEMEIR